MEDDRDSGDGSPPQVDEDIADGWRRAAIASRRTADVGLLLSLAALVTAIVPLVAWRSTAERWCPDVVVYPLASVGFVVAVLGWRNRPHWRSSAFDAVDQHRRKLIASISAGAAAAAVVVLWTLTCPPIEEECDRGAVGLTASELARRCGPTDSTPGDVFDTNVGDP